MYSSKEKEKARREQYMQRPEVKERVKLRSKLRRQTPEYKEYQKEYKKKKRQEEDYKQKEKDRWHKYYETHREQKLASDKKRRSTDEYREKNRERAKKYRQGESYKAYAKRLIESGKAKEYRQRYYHTEKCKARLKEYRKTEKYKEYVRNRRHKQYRQEGGKEKFKLSMLKKFVSDPEKWMKQIYCNHAACLALSLTGRTNVCSQCGRECKPDFHHTDYPNRNVGSFVCKACHYKLNNNLEEPKEIVDLLDILNDKGILLYDK